MLRRCRAAVTILGVLAIVLLPRLTLAVELTESQGAAHAYPALLDTNGKKLADGEFRQWIEDDRLRVEIDYEFDDGQHFEENAVLRQKPELIQEKWSWKESKNGKVSRQFTADFRAKMATALTHENNETKQLSENIEVEPGRAFAGFGFTLALQNLRKRLINGEKVELKAVGFTPKPRLATVQLSYGGLDIWINNAMVSVFSPIKEMTPEEFRRVMEVTFLGSVYGTLAALKRMLPRDRGTIVQVGSALAHRSIPLQSAYCAAKHAVQGFTESLRCELIHDKSKVRVTMVQLPALNTPQFGWVKSRLPRKAQPVPPIFQPEVAAEAIYFAAHHRRREFYVAWSSAKAIIANKIAPGLLDHILARTGYDSQQYDGAEDPNRAHNLWKPMPGDHGAHGDFNARAKKSSIFLWMSQHRGWLVPIVATVALVIIAIFTVR
jgi:NAD(P)-dependent dehydrogenase (short-subunit alcohol dehydrogenase family)